MQVVAVAEETREDVSHLEHLAEELVVLEVKMEFIPLVEVVVA